MESKKIFKQSIVLLVIGLLLSPSIVTYITLLTISGERGTDALNAYLYFLLPSFLSIMFIGLALGKLYNARKVAAAEKNGSTLVTPELRSNAKLQSLKSDYFATLILTILLPFIFMFLMWVAFPIVLTLAIFSMDGFGINAYYILGISMFLILFVNTVRKLLKLKREIRMEEFQLANSVTKDSSNLA